MDSYKALENRFVIDEKLKEKYLISILSNHYAEGIISINNRYYMSKYIGKDKYKENRFIFNSIDMKKYILDKENGNSSPIEKYIHNSDLEVIEDSTQTVYCIELL